MECFNVAQNRMFEAGGRDFLFLTADKAIFEMDGATTALLKKWSSTGPLTEDRVFRDLDGTREEKIDRLRNFARLRVLEPGNSVDAPCASTVPESMKIPLKNLILHVTESCNLRCRYCYYSDESSPQQMGGGGKMPLDTAKAAIDFLVAHSEDLGEIGVVFFGGEPLLNFKLIAAVVAYANERGHAAGKKVTFSLTTNGTLLTDEIVAFLSTHNVSVTVSMDGFKSIHDRYRRFVDGSPSYHVIRPRVLHLIRSLGKPVPARVTLVENAGNVVAILDHLLGMGFAEVGFAPVTSGKRKYQLSENAMDDLLRQFRRLSEKFMEFAHRGEYLGFSNLTDLLVSLHGHELKNYPCGAGLGLFSVSHQGRLFLCQRFTGQEEFSMGNLFNGFDHEKLQSFRANAEISQKKACRTCWVRTICTGGCYHEACVREGDLLKPNLHYCKWIKKWIETGLEFYGRLSVNCPGYLDKLTIMRGQSLDC